MLNLHTSKDSSVNVLIRTYDMSITLGANSEIDILAKTEKSTELERRQSHNVFTNNGSGWLRNLVGAAAYNHIDPANGYIEGTGNVLTSARVAYMGVGVGGALSSAPYFHVQEELPVVNSLEDYVQVDNTPNYLKQVLPQTQANGSFPDSYTIRFSSIFLSTEISFAGNISKSGNVVGTSVPITEAGLYLSSADPLLDPDQTQNKNSLIAYNIFKVITVTPGVLFRIDWDLIFR